MPNNYINVGTATAAAGTSTLYTAGAGTAVVGSLYVGNASGGTARTFSVKPGAAYTHTSVGLPSADAVQIDGIVLAAADTLDVIGSETDVTFVFMGVEIS